VDFPAQATRFLLSSVEHFRLVEIFGRRGIRPTLLIFAADDSTAMASASQTTLTERRRNSDEWNVTWVGVNHSSKIQEKLGAVFGALTSPHNQGKLWKTNRFQKRAGEEQSNSSSGQKVSR
jgi:hypothetical protein